MSLANEPAPIANSPFVRRLLFFVMLIPVASLIAKAMALLIHMMNLPYYDDWREFVRGDAGSFDPRFLFQPANDTLYPVGKFLDGLFVTLLNSNVVVYQFLSMTIVLGSVLTLQHHLLRKSIGNGFIVTASFVSLVLMLQPGAYWGQQYIAYHQAIPLVCILAILALAIRQAAWWRLALMAVLTLIAGFAYISGAFAVVALASVFLLRFRIVGRELRSGLLRAGFIVGAAGLVALAAQVWVIVVAQHGKIHRPDAQWTMPTDVNFWLYALGKIGRALGLSAHYPLVSLIVTLTVVATGVLAVVYLLVRPRSVENGAPDAGGPLPGRQDLFVLILTSLIATIGTYLALIAAGRAGLRPDAIRAPLQIFAFGFIRFHFFWITVLTPWVLAAVLLAVESLSRRASVTAGSSLAAIALVLATDLNGVFAHGHYFAQTAEARTGDIHCIQNQINAGFGRIVCPTAYPSDLMPGFIKATLLDASFTHYLPGVSKLGFVPHGDKVFYRLAGEGARPPVRYVNAAVTKSGNRTVLSAAGDPQVLINIGERAAGCRALQVTITQALEAASQIQVFFRPKGMETFDQHHSAVAAFAAGPVLRTSLILRSPSGFEPLLRVDPATAAQTIDLRNIEIGCLE